MSWLKTWPKTWLKTWSKTLAPPHIARYGGMLRVFGQDRSNER